MKHYTYVRIKVGNWCGAACEEHREIINNYADMGFRYAGYIPTKTSSYGCLKEIDLIFEEDVPVQE